jgi:hypothetical protein
VLPELIRKVDDIAMHIRKGNESVLSARSQWTEYEGDDKQVWREFRRELVGSGFRSADVRMYSSALKVYLQRLKRDGMLDEETIPEEEEQDTEKYERNEEIDNMGNEPKDTEELTQDSNKDDHFSRESVIKEANVEKDPFMKAEEPDQADSSRKEDPQNTLSKELDHAGSNREGETKHNLSKDSDNADSDRGDEPPNLLLDNQPTKKDDQSRSNKEGESVLKVSKQYLEPQLQSISDINARSRQLDWPTQIEKPENDTKIEDYTSNTCLESRQIPVQGKKLGIEIKPGIIIGQMKIVPEISSQMAEDRKILKEPDEALKKVVLLQKHLQSKPTSEMQTWIRDGELRLLMKQIWEDRKAQLKIHEERRIQDLQTEFMAKRTKKENDFKIQELLTQEIQALLMAKKTGANDSKNPPVERKDPPSPRRALMDYLLEK